MLALRLIGRLRPQFMGLRICDDSLKLEHPNGKVKSFNGNRSQPFQRMANYEPARF